MIRLMMNNAYCDVRKQMGKGLTTSLPLPNVRQLKLEDICCDEMEFPGKKECSDAWGLRSMSAFNLPKMHGGKCISGYNIDMYCPCANL